MSKSIAADNQDHSPLISTGVCLQRPVSAAPQVVRKCYQLLDVLIKLSPDKSVSHWIIAELLMSL